MEVSTEMRTSVMELYTAYFNRVSDTAGLDYWVDKMEYNSWTISMVANSFSQQTEYTNLYSGLTYTQIVSTVYNNVLNREADTEGSEYWEGKLNSGDIPVSQFIQAVVNAATEVINGESTNPTDKRIVDNKTEVSQYAYDNNSEDVNISLASISDDSSTVDIAKTAVDDTISSSENTTSALYHKTWSIDGTDFYELGDNLLFEAGDDYISLSNYTVNGDIYILTTIEDGDVTTFSIDNLSVDAIMIDDYGNTNTNRIITSVSEIEEGDSRVWDLYDMSASEYLSNMQQEDTVYMTISYDGLKATSDYYLYDSTTNEQDLGIGYAKNDKLYIVEVEDGAYELEISDGTTTQNYYLGEIA